MNEDEPPFVRIGAREIYDKLEAVHADVQELKRTAADIEKHEARLNALERWRYGVGAALVTAITSAAITAARSIGQA
ncbi:hypothetical protein [Streptomyces lycii]|uniref:DUF3618 domain-containing protein n=1 Tax=Streptomyces lycii TaxID=2654337 RepID=A0ABQ7FM05_9ACTN|nr:hypothetical protein [Streptomyces lycii]KAF4408649.1 hypothetical protein GCU69_13195 [Streptomyces lycii]